MAEFGRGLPRGGEEVVKRSLEQQEAVVRAMTREEKDNLELVLTPQHPPLKMYHSLLHGNWKLRRVYLNRRNS